MKSRKAFWKTIFLLAILGLGGCAQLATQKSAALTPEQQEEEKRSLRAERTE